MHRPTKHSASSKSDFVIQKARDTDLRVGLCSISFRTILMTALVVTGLCVHRPAQAQSSPKETSPTEIEVWWGIGGQIGSEFNKLIDAFNRSHSEIVATVRTFNGYGSVRRALREASQTGKFPDVEVVEVHQIASLAAEQAIEPLDPFIQNDATFGRDDLLPGVLTNLHYQKKLFALPLSRSTPILYYNKDRFIAAGLDPDKPPQTWEDVRKAAAKLTATKGGPQYGLLVSAWPWIFESLVWTNGGELIVGGKAKFAEPGAKPLQLWADLVHQDKTAQFGTASDIYSEFFSENAAMVFESTAVLQMFTMKCHFTIGTAPLPPSAGSKTAVPTGGGAAVIPAANSAERKAAAWKLLTWLIATKQTAEWSQDTGYLPLRKSARALVKKGGFYRDSPEFETAIKELSFARESPENPRWGGAASNIIAGAMTKVLGSNAPALETLKTAEGEVDKILKPRVAQGSK
jgi:sn-glycerol 3-phosphate transport system substrate-binding protein